MYRMPSSVQLPKLMGIYLSKLISEHLKLVCSILSPFLFFTQKIKPGNCKINSLTHRNNPQPFK